MAPLLKNRLLSSFSILSSATLSAIVFSVLTNKAIAVIAGPEGIALMGIYRTLGSLVSGTITMGFATIVLQRVSTARDRGEVDSVLGAASLLFLLQASLILLLAATVALPLARWLLGSSFTGVTAGEVRIVLAMALVNVLLGLINAALNAQSNTRAIATVQLATSLSSLLLIYPLLCLGREGLAANVASGGLLGSCIGLYYLRQIFGFSIGGSWAPKWKVLRSSVSTSAWVVAQNLVITGGLLNLQKLFGRHYGLDTLGGFNAAMLVIDTLILVIMSSTRTYALPALGRLSEESQKHALMARIMALRLVAMTAVSALIVFGGKLVLLALFSRRFLGSEDVLAILSLSLVSLSFSWSFNSFLLHKGDIRSYVIIDTTWIVAMLSAAWACGHFGLSPTYMAWAYTGSCVLSAALYAWVCTRRYGRGLLTNANIALGLVCLGWVCSAYFISRHAPLLSQAVFVCASIASAWALGVGRKVGSWLEFDQSSTPA